MAPAFSRQPLYAGPLGAAYSTTHTTFRVWAPTARAVTLNLYAAGLGGMADERVAHVRRLESAPGRHAEWPDWVAPDLIAALATASGRS